MDDQIRLNSYGQIHLLSLVFKEFCRTKLCFDIHLLTELKENYIFTHNFFFIITKKIYLNNHLKEQIVIHWNKSKQKGLKNWEKNPFSWDGFTKGQF